MLGVEPLAFRGAGRRGAAAGLRHDHRPLQEVRQFFKTVGDVSRLVAVPLAGNHERPVAGETGPLTLEQPSPHVVWQMRGMNRIETEHRLAAGAIDVLTTWSAAPCKLPLQRRRGDQELTDTDFLFLGHDAVAWRVIEFPLFYTGIHQMTKRMLNRLSLIALVAMALAAGRVVAQELGSVPGAATERHSPSVADLWTRPGEDWGTFLGPTGNGRSSLKGMTVPWPAGGPRIVWHSKLGEGYCGPAVAQGRCVICDRVGQEIRIRCLAAETGQELWLERYPTDYVDTFGYDGGPRSAAVIVEDAVITFGPEGRLECRSLADGASRWQVDTSTAYHVVRNFFGVSAAPLVVDIGGKRLVVVQVGGSPAGAAPPSPERLDLVKGLDSGLVAFELATGRECWRSSDQLASYSTPVRATLDGRDSILAWMRDRFLVVDPATGGVRADFRWRADELFSVVAASPVVAGNEVLLSETYGPGSVLLAVTAAGLKPVRRDAVGSRPNRSLKSHWATPVLHNGHLYGSSGRNAGDALLVCADWKTGGILWSESGLGRSSLTGVEDHLIVLGEFGDLVLVKATPDAYTEVSRTRLVAAATDTQNATRQTTESPGGTQESGVELLVAPCWAAPVIAHGYLYVRGQGRLICLDLLPTKTN